LPSKLCVATVGAAASGNRKLAQANGNRDNDQFGNDNRNKNQFGSTNSGAFNNGFNGFNGNNGNNGNNNLGQNHSELPKLQHHTSTCTSTAFPEPMSI